MSPRETEELVSYRFDKAKKALAAMEVLVNNELWNEAINRLYYACFYAVGALLASRVIYTKTHTGAKQMFGLHFVKTGIVSEELSDFYSKLFSLRQSGDYEDYCDYEQEDVLELVTPAKDFINAIERILYNK